MTLTIRDFAPADAQAAAEAYSAGRPHLFTTPEAVLWQQAQPHRRMLVAELDGAVVGTARHGEVVSAEAPGVGTLNISVLPEFRRRGIGGALLEAAERALAGLGVESVRSWVDEESGALAFAARRGYRDGARTAVFAGCDLTAGPPAVPAVPPGIELRTAADYLDDPHPLYLLDIAGSADEPSDLPFAAQPFEQWLAEVWQRPDLNRELTTVAVADGTPVALSAALTAGERYWSAFTTTHPGHRGRGLAKLAKSDSLHRARAAGLTAAYTNNDEGNAPMLAVNAWLGYRSCATERRHTRELPPR